VALPVERPARRAVAHRAVLPAEPLAVAEVALGLAVVADVVVELQRPLQFRPDRLYAVLTVSRISRAIGRRQRQPT